LFPDTYRDKIKPLAVIFYNIFLLLFRLAIGISSFWNKKAGQWLRGRKNIFPRINAELKNNYSQLIWFHCSSLGEFEQGRPVLEKLKSEYPHSRFLLTFFSPSGYEIRKDYKEVDWVFYLPVDSPANAKRFFDIVNPALVVFVKYDYWYYYLTECSKRNIPLLMISAVFRKNQPFFKWYGALHRKMLRCFTHFFVQDENSKSLLQQQQINNVTAAGDTRFDRVAAIAEKFEPLAEIEKFCGNSQVLVAGSTWLQDEKIIKEAVASVPYLKIIIAPHEIHKEHLQLVKLLFPNNVFYSLLTTGHAQSKTYNCLIIDNIGLLSRLYRYATITYVGGGFTNGIHNLPEAAVYGRPVLFGPNHKKFREAVELTESGGGISISSSDEFSAWLKKLLTDKKEYEHRCKHAAYYVHQKKGATEKIIRYIQENRLLTSW
jgi:3-deoxy-D-manno-octulosonic-acid transferase